MRLNSEASIRRGRQLLRDYGGSWERILKAGVRNEDGHLEVPAKPPNR